MEQKTRRALRPPKSARGGKRKLTEVLMSLLLLFGVTSCKDWVYREFTDYTLKVYFLDGSTKTVRVQNCSEGPAIKASRGSYYIVFGNGESILGVDRFEVLSKERKMKKKKIEPRHYWFSPNLNEWEEVTSSDSLYLTQKGGAR